MISNNLTSLKKELMQPLGTPSEYTQENNEIYKAVKRADALSRRDFLWLGITGLAAAGAYATGRYLQPATEIVRTVTETITATKTQTEKETKTVTETQHNSADYTKVEGNQIIYQNKPFKLKGFNYYPKNFGWRIFKAWDEDKSQVEYELSLADVLKCNSIRTFVNYQYSINNVNFQKPSTLHPVLDPKYVKSIKEFLDLAESHNLKVILSLFEYVYWDLFEPTYQQLGTEYLQQLIPQFANDSRILAWDVINEPDLKTPYSQPNGVENITSFLKKMSEKIRDLDKNHLITMGLGKSENVPKINGIEEFTDFISFHDYDIPERLPSKITELKKLKRPIVLEEFGRHSYPDPVWPQTEDDQRDYYAAILPIVRDMDLNGSLFWELMDHPVVSRPDITMGPVYDGKDNIQHHFGIYRIDYTHKPAEPVIQRFYSQ